MARDVQLLAAAADPYRMRVIQLLAARGRICVCDLEAGLVSSTRRGRWVDYELDEDALAELRAAVPVPSGSPGCESAAARGDRP